MAQRAEDGDSDGDGPGGPLVWVIGADHWPRAVLRAELIERGYHAVGFSAVGDAATRLVLARAPAPALIVLDLQQQQIDARLLDLVFRPAIPLVAVAGATEASDQALRRRGWAAFLQRPITLGAIADTVERLLRPGLSGDQTDRAR